MIFLRIFGAKDTLIYGACSLFGYLVFLAFRPAAWAGAVAVLTTYNLFLAFRVAVPDPENDRSRTYAIPATIAAHLGFLVVCVSARMAVFFLVADSVRSQPKPLHGVAIAFGAKLMAIVSAAIIYGLVSLECHLLFHGSKQNTFRDLEPFVVELSAKLRKNDTELIPATADDHNAWVEYCSRRSATYYNPALAPQDNFEHWLRARGKTQSSRAESSYTWITDEPQPQIATRKMPSLSGD